MVRILIVDDSPTVRFLLRQILDADPEIEVVGTANDGVDAIRKTLALKPDLITMDVHMPVMDGLEAIRRIMAQRPTPIVVLSTKVNVPEMMVVFKAIQAGALDVLEKPVGVSHKDFDVIRNRLTSTVKLMADVKVVRRPFPGHRATNNEGISFALQSLPEIIGIASSTGGPAALNTLFQELPPDFTVPIVVVQHMGIGFTQGMINWLQTNAKLPIQIADEGEKMQPGHIYFAPEDCHLEVANGGYFTYNHRPPVNFVRPAANVLFESIASVYGSKSIGVVLTGMGKDGALGLRSIRDSGGFTIAQDEATSVVYGMPKAALEMGAVDSVLSIDEIGPALVRATQKNTSTPIT